MDRYRIIVSSSIIYREDIYSIFLQENDDTSIFMQV